MAVMGNRLVTSRIKAFPRCGGGAALAGYGGGGLAAVIESDGKPVPGQQGIHVHRAEELLLSSNDSAETFDSVVILSLAVLCVGEADAAPQGIGVIRPERSLPSFSSAAQDLLGLAIGTLFH